MVSMEDAVIARLESHGEKFEILVDPDAVDEIKRGKVDNILEYLAIEDIFKDVHKGDRASSESLNKVFGTEDVAQIAYQIIKKGDIQLTTEQRKKKQEEKRKQIIAFISRNAINPQTNTPHPPQRIDNAMKEARVLVDPFKPLDTQIQDTLKAIKPILPIKIEKIIVAVKVPGDAYGKVYGEIKNMGTITKEEWQKDGSWIAMVELPAGIRDDFFNVMNSRSRGSTEIKIIKQ